MSGAELEKEISIFKVLTEKEYESFNEAGEFLGSKMDIEDGFIHMSTEAQLERILTKYFSGQDVMIAQIDYEALISEIKWEAASNGDLFPHLYRPLLLSEVITAETHTVS